MIFVGMIIHFQLTAITVHVLTLLRLAMTNIVAFSKKTHCG